MVDRLTEPPEPADRLTQFFDGLTEASHEAPVAAADIPWGWSTPHPEDSAIRARLRLEVAALREQIGDEGLADYLVDVLEDRLHYRALLPAALEALAGQARQMAEMRDTLAARESRG